MIRVVRTVLAAIMVAAGATAFVAGPAEAEPPGCSYVAGHFEQAGSYITGYRYWACENGDLIPLSVSVQRFLSPGVYETVASGQGEATYYCAGTLFNKYRTTGTADFEILCS